MIRQFCYKNVAITLKNYFLSHFRLVTQLRVAYKRKCHIYCNNIKYKFDPNEIFTPCDSGAPNDICQFLLNCNHYSNIRNRFFPNLNSQMSPTDNLSEFFLPHTNENTLISFTHLKYCLAARIN